MAEGGSFLDGARETARGLARATRALPRVVERLANHLLHFPKPVAFAEHVWEAGHDDQRLSWFAHWLICLGATAVFGGGAVAWVPTAGLWPTFGVSLVMWLIYMYREAGDQRYHEDEEEDWDEEDKDVDWQGKAVEGVTPRYDKIGDLTGPTFNCGTMLIAAIIVDALMRTMTWTS